MVIVYLIVVFDKFEQHEFAYCFDTEMKAREYYLRAVNKAGSISNCAGR